ncbi:MAG TPA: FecR domain-containing protein [Polyangiaceae bacterium]|jgi:transmembrane sensor|nr:FecR domain-containing protein [Polyangiaceae bacterium]
MATRERELDAALGAVNPEWTAADTERALVRLQQSVERRRAVAWGTTAALVAAAGIAFGFARVHSHETAEKPTLAPSSQERVVRFSDGSTVHLLDATTDVSIVEARPERIVSALDHGAATFEVTHVDGRVFRVQAGQVIVEAIGTVFTVDRRDGAVRVSVGRGRVRVDFGTGNTELAVGQSGTFPPPNSEAATAMPSPSPSAASASDAAAPSASAIASASSSSNSKANWKELARDGKSSEAYRALASAPESELNGAEALLLAADSARLTGHPNEAVRYLSRVLRDYKGDPRAPLAAFSLGRVLMNSLGRPAEAAGYFEKARSLSREPSLAEDALAREVEALARAGQADGARRKAEDYLRLYPNGQRLNAVKTFGGIE